MLLRSVVAAVTACTFGSLPGCAGELSQQIGPSIAIGGARSPVDEDLILSSLVALNRGHDAQI